MELIVKKTIGLLVAISVVICACCAPWRGNRVQKSSPSGTVNYLYDGFNAVEEVDPSGNVLARYTQGGIDEPFVELRSGTSSYYELDGLGSNQFAKQFHRSVGEHLRLRFLRKADGFNGCRCESIPIHWS